MAGEHHHSMRIGWKNRLICEVCDKTQHELVLEQQLAQAKGLLEDAVTHMMLTRTTETKVYQQIRAFLVTLHKEQAHGG